jgi:hypothetical protein
MRCIGGPLHAAADAEGVRPLTIIVVTETPTIHEVIVI